MAAPLPSAVRPSAFNRAFNTTHWSLIRAAGDVDSPETTQALEALCRIYWYPIYAHVRHRVHSPEEAEDLTQEFFFRLLRSNAFSRADPSLGRFRSFMLGSLKHFLRDARAYAHAQKRGGNQTIISWDQAVAEARLADMGADKESPDRIFDRRWAEAMLEEAITRLRVEYERSGRKALFDALSMRVTTEDREGSFAEVAARLGTTVSAIKSAAFRLRRRYHTLIRDVVAQTLDDTADLDDELRHLLAAIVPASPRT